MKSKGSVDFFLGVFLEFGAAFCLLFFLPQVPWHWAVDNSPRANGKPVVTPANQRTVARRVTLRPLRRGEPRRVWRKGV